MNVAGEGESRLSVTHPSLHIRNPDDALRLLEAVRRGILPLITARMGREREQLRGGNVFVWEECVSSEGGGLVRWTDGRRWSQSKVHADCLFYEEKIEVTDEEREAKALRRVKRICNPGTNVPPPSRNRRPAKFGGLTKQTYSFQVRRPGDLGDNNSVMSRKWHLVAYTVWSDRGTLPTIEHYSLLHDIVVPPGIFTRSRVMDSAAAAGSTATSISTSINHPGSPSNYNPAGLYSGQPIFRVNGGYTTSVAGPSRLLPQSSVSLPRDPSAFTRGANNNSNPPPMLPPISSFSWNGEDDDSNERGERVAMPRGDPVSSEGRRVLERFKLRF